MRLEAVGLLRVDLLQLAAQREVARLEQRRGHRPEGNVDERHGEEEHLAGVGVGVRVRVEFRVKVRARGEEAHLVGVVGGHVAGELVDPVLGGP